MREGYLDVNRLANRGFLDEDVGLCLSMLVVLDIVFNKDVCLVVVRCVIVAILNLFLRKKDVIRRPYDNIY